MSAIQMVPLEELMVARLGSVDPSKFVDETFELYSIPAFDSRKPEVVTGEQIGSAKQIVQPRDVLLSKIVPHIRRSWIVGPAGRCRQIASGEWIVFRSDRATPEYLRHILLGDDFHSQFMQTVSGVGGSLLRARPAQVAKIRVPLPQLSEQRRIAAILDKTDDLRTKRREALAQLDRLAQAIFVEMFGDPVANEKGLPVAALESLCRRVTDGTHQSPTWVSDGIPFLFISNIVDGEITFNTEKFISSITYDELTRRCPIENGDVLFTTVGSYGNTAIVHGDRKFCFQRHIAHIKPDPELLDPSFCAAMLGSVGVRRQVDGVARGVAQKTVNLADLKKLRVFAPSLALQRAFTERLDTVHRLKRAQKLALAEHDEMFSALQTRAFSGDL